MAAARCGLRAATRRTWPPESEKPQSEIRVGSDLREGPREVDGGLPVGELLADADDLPWGTAALPERR